MVAIDLQPLTTVENKGLTRVLSLLDKKYRMPTRRTLTTRLLPELYNEEKTKIKTILQKTKGLSITTDLWTSPTQTSFIAVTAHFWRDGEQKLSSKNLECVRVSGRHVAKNLTCQINKILNDYEVKDKVIAAVTDNASNITKAIKDGRLQHLPCLAHTLNLVVTQAIESATGLQDVKDRVSRLVSLSKRSTVVAEKLEDFQKNLGMRPKKLVRDVSTRWNSTFEMFDRFLELKTPITLLFSEPEASEIGSFSPDKWSMLAQAVEVLQVCYQATLEISGDIFATGSKAIPLAKNVTVMLCSERTISSSFASKRPLLPHSEEFEYSPRKS